MNREIPDQGKILPELLPEHERSFGFIKEKQTDDDRKRGIIRIKDGVDVYKFGSMPNGRVMPIESLDRLTGQKARHMTAMAKSIFKKMKKDMEARVLQHDLEFGEKE